MSVEEKLTTLLGSDAGVIAIVGGRIYPMGFMVTIENPVYPAVTYARVASSPVYSLRGHSGQDNPLIQVDCWANTYAGAKSLSEAVLAAVDGATTLKGVLRMDRDLYESDPRIFRVSMDWSFWETQA